MWPDRHKRTWYSALPNYQHDIYMYVWDNIGLLRRNAVKNLYCMLYVWLLQEDHFLNVRICSFQGWASGYSMLLGAYSSIRTSSTSVLHACTVYVHVYEHVHICTCMKYKIYIVFSYLHACTWTFHNYIYMCMHMYTCTWMYMDMYIHVDMYHKVTHKINSLTNKKDSSLSLRAVR